jgi:hypothetical protein
MSLCTNAVNHLKSFMLDGGLTTDQFKLAKSKHKTLGAAGNVDLDKQVTGEEEVMKKLPLGGVCVLTDKCVVCCRPTVTHGGKRSF